MLILLIVKMLNQPMAGSYTQGFENPVTGIQHGEQMSGRRSFDSDFDSALAADGELCHNVHNKLETRCVKPQGEA